MSDDMIFRIEMGNFKEEYHLYKTDAERNYDYAGVIEIYSHQGKDDKYEQRHVLVPLSIATSQVMRCRSGLRLMEREEMDKNIIGSLTEKLLKRIKEIFFKKA